MKKVATYLLLLGLAVLLLHFSFRGIKWNEFWADIQIANYKWIIFSMAFGAMGFWIRAMRWRVLIRGAGYQVSKGSAFDAVNMAYLTNFALPRAGELARCGVLTKTAGIPFDALLGTVVLERAFDILCLLVVSALVITLQWNVFGLFMEQQLWNPFLERIQDKISFWIIVLLVLLILFGFLILFRKSLQKSTFMMRAYEMAAGLFRAIRSGFRTKQKGAFFGYTLTLWLFYWATCWCTIMAFPLAATLTPIDALFLMVVGSMGWVVPVQGGMGAFHFIVSLALTSVYAVGQTQSIVFATISHESQAVTMILFGLFSLIRIGFAKKRQGV